MQALAEWGQPAVEASSREASKRFIFMYFLRPHWLPWAAWPPAWPRPGRGLTATGRSWPNWSCPLSYPQRRRELHGICHTASTLPRTSSLSWPLITSSFRCTSFSDMVCCLLSEWCVAASFHQRAANLVFFISATYCTLSHLKGRRNHWKGSTYSPQ